MLENERVLPALSRGWEIFRRNLGPLLLMEIILAVINFAVGFVVAIPLLVLLVPSIYAFMAGNIFGNGPNWSAFSFALACMCILAPVLWLISGIMVAYIESAWTLTYMRITKPVDDLPAVTEANA